MTSQQNIQRSYGSLIMCAVVALIMSFEGCEVQDPNTRIQHPIDIRFQVVDQYGVAAPHHRVKLVFGAFLRLPGIDFGGWRDCYLAETDGQGYAEVRSRWKGAYNVQLREVDVERYVFSREQFRRASSDISYYTDAQHPVVVQVLRHGQPIKPKRWSSAKLITVLTDNRCIPVRIGEAAFSLDDNEHSAEFEITVSNAKALWDRDRSSADLGAQARSKNTWPEVKIVSRGRYLFCGGSQEFVTDAPEDGYKKEINGEIRNDQGYNKTFPFFAYDTQLHRYLWLSAYVGIANSAEGPCLDFELEGYCNQDGSKNLYLERFPYREELDRQAHSCP